MASETKDIIRSLLISTPVKCTIKQLCSDFRDTVGYNIPFQKSGFSSVREYLCSIPDTVKIIGSGPNAEVHAVITQKSAHINDLVAKQRKDHIPIHKRKNVRTYEGINDCLAQSVSGQNSLTESANDAKNTSKFEDEYRSRVPKKMQNNLRKLIMQFPEGIRCTKFKTEYKKIFKEDLCYERYRFRSLIELCTDLPEILYYVQITSDDFMLYDATRSIPSMDQNVVKEENQTDIDRLRDSSSLDWSLGSSLVPSDIVHLSEEIPRIDLKKGDAIDVYVGEIYDINNFWMFMKHRGLVSLLEELQNFSSRRNRYVIPEVFLEAGLYCTVFYQDEYHRCVVVDALPKLPGFVQVLFVDYGSVGRVSTRHVWYLPRQFGSLPCQAIKANLSGVRPKRSEARECNARFTASITNASLVAEIVEVRSEDMTAEVSLADITDEKNVFCINDLLVEQRLAEYCQ